MQGSSCCRFDARITCERRAINKQEKRKHGRTLVRGETSTKTAFRSTEAVQELCRLQLIVDAEFAEKFQMCYSVLWHSYSV